MQKIVKAKNPTDFFIIVHDGAKDELSFEANGRIQKLAQTNSDLRVGIFKVSPGKGFVSIFSDSLGRNGELTVRVAPADRELTCCFIDENENGNKFEIPSGVDSIQLSYSPSCFSLSYEEPKKESDDLYDDSYNYFYDDPIDCDEEPIPEYDEQEKNRLSAENEKLRKGIKKNQDEIGKIREEHERLTERIDEVRAERRAVEKLLKENERMTNEENDLETLMCRHGIAHDMLQPYLTNSPDRAYEAETYLDKAYSIIEELINEHQEKADNDSLPDKREEGGESSE